MHNLQQLLALENGFEEVLYLQKEFRQLLLKKVHINYEDVLLFHEGTADLDEINVSILTESTL